MMNEEPDERRRRWVRVGRDEREKGRKEKWEEMKREKEREVDDKAGECDGKSCCWIAAVDCEAARRQRRKRRWPQQKKHTKMEAADRCSILAWWADGGMMAIFTNRLVKAFLKNFSVWRSLTPRTSEQLGNLIENNRKTMIQNQLDSILIWMWYKFKMADRLASNAQVKLMAETLLVERVFGDSNRETFQRKNTPLLGSFELSQSCCCRVAACNSWSCWWLEDDQTFTIKVAQHLCGMWTNGDSSSYVRLHGGGSGRQQKMWLPSLQFRRLKQILWLRSFICCLLWTACASTTHRNQLRKMATNDHTAHACFNRRVCRSEWRAFSFDVLGAFSQENLSKNCLTVCP